MQLQLGTNANIWSWAQLVASANAPPNEVTFASKEVSAPLKIVSDAAVSVRCFSCRPFLDGAESVPKLRYDFQVMCRESMHQTWRTRCAHSGADNAAEHLAAKDEPMKSRARRMHPSASQQWDRSDAAVHLHLPLSSFSWHSC